MNQPQNVEEFRFRLSTVEKLTKEQMEHRVQHAIAIERIQYSMENIEKSQEDIKKTLHDYINKQEAKSSWLSKTALGVVVVAIVGWILKGGLLL